jgi:hypothetical protein
MDLSELRPDFVEQVVNLRRTVLNKLEPKKIDGNVLDGESLAIMAEKYVGAINDGAIPNIQSTWQYICKDRATKAIKKAVDSFEQQGFTVPQDHQELESSIDEAIKESLSLLKKKYLHNVDPSILISAEEELAVKLAEMKEEKTSENLRQCQAQAFELLEQIFTELESQIKQKDQNRLDPSQLELAINDISLFYEQKTYDFPEKFFMLADKKVTFLSSIYQQYLSTLQKEVDTASQIQENSKQKLESVLREAKQEHRQERDRLDTDMREIQTEKAKLEAMH